MTNMCSQESIVSQLNAVKLPQGTVVETEFRRIVSEKLFTVLTRGLSPVTFATDYFPNSVRVVTQGDSRVVEEKKNIMFTRLLGWKFSVDTEIPLKDPHLPTFPTSQKTTERFTLSREKGICVTCNKSTTSENVTTFSIEIDSTGEADDLAKRFNALFSVATRLQEKIGIPWNIINTVINAIAETGDSRSSLSRPENLTREYMADHLLTKKHVISAKIDGFTGLLIIERGSVALCRLGDDAMIVHGDSAIVFSPGAVVIVGEIVEGGRKTLFYPFDIIADKSRHLDYMKRLSWTKEVRDSLGTMKSLEIWMKSFVKVGESRESLASAFKKILGDTAAIESRGTPTDGVIFTLLDSRPWGTFLPPILKWKPWEKLTIDFKAEADGALSVFDTPSTGHVPFPVKGLKFNGVPADAEGKVVEMAPVREEDGTISFSFVRFREDKLHANSVRTARNVWKDIKSPIPQSTLLGEDLSMLFFLTNVMKREVIGKIPRGAIVIDIGSGRGGDLMKYEHQGASHVIAIEPDAENRLVMEERLKEVKTKTQWTVVSCGGEDTKTIVETLKEVLAKPREFPPTVWVSMMLSMSFFWKDEDTLDSLRKTLLSVCELCGGSLSLVFCTVEGQRVKTFLSGKDIDTDVLKMSFTEDDSCGVGIKGIVKVDIPGSIVKDQTEYLVDLMDLGVDEEKVPLTTFPESSLMCLTSLEAGYARTTVTGMISFTS